MIARHKKNNQEITYLKGQKKQNQRHSEPQTTLGEAFQRDQKSG